MWTRVCSTQVPGPVLPTSPVLPTDPARETCSATASGVDSVGALLGGMMEVSQGSFQLTVAGPAMVNGDLVAVPVRFTGTCDGASMDMAGIDLLTVRAGKIVEVHLFSEDGAAEDAFWGRA